MRKIQILRVLLCILLFGTGAVHADSTVSVKGVVTSIPCTITQKNNGIVDFGDVLTTRIDGSSYKSYQLVLDLQCDTPVNADTMLNLSLSGTEAPFGEGLLATDKEGLGIQFRWGDQKYPVNSAVSFAYLNHDHSVYMSVTPAKDDSVELEGGAFTATATLTVDYQ
ncbi:fimbrial protein [Dryocola clanedunensis]